MRLGPGALPAPSSQHPHTARMCAAVGATSVPQAFPPAAQVCADVTITWLESGRHSGNSPFGVRDMPMAYAEPGTEVTPALPTLHIVTESNALRATLLPEEATAAGRVALSGVTGLSQSPGCR